MSMYSTNIQPAVKHPGKIHLLFLILISVLLAFTMIGCGESSTGPGVGNGNGQQNGNNENGNEEPGPDEVWMVGQSFTPGNIEVEVGTTVTWENRSSEVHTVTSGTGGNHDGEFDSGNISPGAEFSYTFNDVGEFSYFCIPHPGMTGTVTVVD